YGALLHLRAELYRRHGLASYRAPCPVISVGNLSAGGTGKTPMVLWLAQRLRGWPQRLAIVSRGYGAAARPVADGPRGVTVVADPDGIRLASPQAGDEPLLLARNLPGVTVLTGANRARLIEYAVTRYGAGIILMDDGFQHLRVQRDLDLLLMDARHPLGNGHVLPGGILREWPRAVQRADAILLTRCPTEALFEQAREILAPWVCDKPLLRADHQGVACLRLGDEQPLPLATLAQQPVLAFCGIARPDSFARSLAAISVSSRAFLAFPDHFAFTRASITRLIQQARACQAEALLCTEKDAVKVQPEWLEEGTSAFPLYYLRMRMHFATEPLWLNQRLRLLLGPAGPDAGPHPPA
ncbi:MAG: tetraacyldisaccharide 4'-kinase, partial [Magnetococcales bacterium]|nr:tetraacyldisaccharide 4'-kinase [Magnetococcales bacterium]